MILGDPNTLAIEWEIYPMSNLAPPRALGFFCVHVGGIRYGVKEPGTTMLGASIGEVESRLANRGEHVAAFAHKDAFAIAKAYRRSVYEDCPADEVVFGLPVNELGTLFQRVYQWAPDGDEAFDDGSYILQFDIGDHVRVIAFQTNDSGEVIRGTLTDAMIPSENFYDLLRAWLTTIKAEVVETRAIH